MGEGRALCALSLSLSLSVFPCVCCAVSAYQQGSAVFDRVIAARCGARCGFFSLSLSLSLSLVWVCRFSMFERRFSCCFGFFGFFRFSFRFLILLLVWYSTKNKCVKGLLDVLGE